MSFLSETALTKSERPARRLARERARQKLIETGLEAMKNLEDKKLTYKYCMTFARRTGFDDTVLRVIFIRLRTRRQQLLRGANAKWWRHPIMWFKFHGGARKLQRLMEELFLDLYAQSGSEYLYQDIAELNFVTEDYLARLIEERKLHVTKIDEAKTVLMSVTSTPRPKKG